MSNNCQTNVKQMLNKSQTNVKHTSNKVYVLVKAQLRWIPFNFIDKCQLKTST